MTPPGFAAAPSGTRELYLDLMKRVLMNWIYAEAEDDTLPSDGRSMTPQNHIEGRIWPRYAHTMVGRARLDNVQECVERVIADGVPGDFLEAGVWRGGTSIFMRAILAAYGITDRTVWVADSFRGLPPPDAEKYPKDKGLDLSGFSQLAVSMEQVQANFQRYGLLDAQVQFLPGWFRDTLLLAPVKTLAVLRLDGDLYESTIDTLTNLYPKLSMGGFAIVDDYGAVPAARAAVDDYRRAQNIDAALVEVDWTGVCWRKS